MENLPPEITLDILSRLPAESVLQCKQVCKTWRTLLRLRTYFGDIHLRRQLLQLVDDPKHQLNNGSAGRGLLFLICFCKGETLYGQLYHYGCYDEINNIEEQLFSYKKLARFNHHAIKMSHQDGIVGSCNGLVCFNIPHETGDPIYVCNPFTSEYVNLPRFHHYLPNGMPGHMANGFGYHTFTNEYKVVRIYYPSYSSGGNVQVYTLGGGTGWRNKGQVNYLLGPGPGLLLNGALHWIDYKKLNIVAFNLVDEEFSLLSSPPCFIPDRLDQTYDLQVLGGCLSVVHKVRGRRVDIWLLKRKKNSSYVMEEQECYSWCWSKDFSIPLERDDIGNYYRPFALTKSSKVLLWFNERILACYDPKTRTLKKVWDHGKEFVKCLAVLHMNSFVSLKAIGEKSKRRRYRISRSIRARN